MTRIHKGFYNSIGYLPKEQKYFVTALTHSSYTNESVSAAMDNERLEFLGDSVLGFITAEYLYIKYTDKPEGELTKLRALIVCQDSLFAAAKRLKLGTYVLLGKGEESQMGRSKPSILSDVLEAVIGAVYLDGGLKSARGLVLNKIVIPFLNSEDMIIIDDYKSRLQMIVQKQPDARIEYTVINKTGPAHDISFEVTVEVNGSVRGRGSGKSKKEAEQAAARNALNEQGQYYEHG